jgi:hypothetical protein
MTLRRLYCMIYDVMVSDSPNKKFFCDKIILSPEETEIAKLVQALVHSS